MVKLFLKMQHEKDGNSKKIIGYTNIELFFKGFGENESFRIKRELEPLITARFPVYKIDKSSVIITLKEITTNPEKESSYVIYTKITVKKEYNPNRIELSLNNRNAYILDFRNNPDVAIKLILKLIFENI